MYHTVRSRRLDEDYTSYIPCGRYIGMCVTVKYVDVNMGGFFCFVLGVSRFQCTLSGTINSTVRCHRSVRVLVSGCGSCIIAKNGTFHQRSEVQGHFTQIAKI